MIQYAPLKTIKVLSLQNKVEVRVEVVQGTLGEHGVLFACQPRNNKDGDGEETKNKKKEDKP